MYLAEKTGRFMPSETAARYEVVQWLMFQMGGVGPMFGQVHHFKRAAKEQVPYAIDRYYTECRRLYGVLDARLDGREHLAGDLSIADFATLPWVFPPRLAGGRPRRLPEREALVREPDGAPCRPAWHGLALSGPANQRGVGHAPEVRERQTSGIGRPSAGGARRNSGRSHGGGPTSGGAEERI